MPELHQLTDLQIAILRLLWEKGEATVAEIHGGLHADRGLAPTTVATLLSRLEKRGVVRHRTQARQFVYSATVTEADVRRTMLSELTEQLFDGDVAELVSHLLDARGVQAGDLDRVRELIAAHEAKQTEDRS